MNIRKSVVGAACAYEIIAVSTGKVPPITDICRKYKWAEALLLSWLVFHFHRKIGEVQ